MLRLIERYANFVSRLAVSLVPVEPLSGWLAGLLFAPLVLLCAVVVLVPLMFGLALVHKLLEAIWPSALWAQVVFSAVLLIVGVFFLVFLVARSEGNNKTGD